MSSLRPNCKTKNYPAGNDLNFWTKTITDPSPNGCRNKDSSVSTNPLQRDHLSVEIFLDPLPTQSFILLLADASFCVRMAIWPGSNAICLLTSRLSVWEDVIIMSCSYQVCWSKKKKKIQLIIKMPSFKCCKTVSGTSEYGH